MMTSFTRCLFSLFLAQFKLSKKSEKNTIPTKVGVSLSLPQWNILCSVTKWWTNWSVEWKTENPWTEDMTWEKTYTWSSKPLNWKFTPGSTSCLMENRHCILQREEWPWVLTNGKDWNRPYLYWKTESQNWGQWTIKWLEKIKWKRLRSRTLTQCREQYNMKLDLCVSHNYTQRDPRSCRFPPPTPPPPLSSSSSYSATVLLRPSPPPPLSALLRHSPFPPFSAADAAAAITLKFNPKYVKNKNKTKHIMKISHINLNIYDKTATSQYYSDYDVE